VDFTTYLIYAISFTVVGEGLNCMYPRIEESYDSEGFVCSWEEDDFYSINDQYILAPEDSTDNYFEAKARKRYWNNQ
jgi:tRNA-binding EMAP/Myf-like protein